MKRILLILVLCIAATLSAFGQTYTLCDKWVDCGNSGQLLDPYYSEGVTIKWNGNLKNGKADGFGTAIKYKNGEYESTYEGEYKNGIREGKGKFTHADGSVKTGTFVNGQLTGRGVAETDDGHRYEGEFINYRMHGKGKIEYANGASFDGYLVSDAPYTGKFVNYDGTAFFIQQGEVVDKITETKSNYSPKIGTRVREYFDENWHRCDAKNAAYYRLITYAAPHKPAGVVKDYYISGELQGEETFVYIDYDDEHKNFQEGEVVWYYKNGQKSKEGYIYNNKANGPYTEYYENGAVYSEYHYDMGTLDGAYITYYPSGEPEKVARYDNGVLKNNKYLLFGEEDGCCLVYNENFHKNRESWEYAGANGALRINDDNTISLEVTPNRTVSGGIYTDFASDGNNVVEITTRQRNNDKNVAVGILVGFKDWDNYCGFYISGKQYAFHQVKNGKTLNSTGWEYSEAIEPDINTMRVINADNRIILNINGEDVADMRRVRYDGGFCVLSVINNGYDIAYVDAGGLNLYEFVEDESAIRDYIPSRQSSGNDWVSSGSGFFIDERGYIATNYHVVDGARTIEVAFIRNGEAEKYPASVVLSDKQNDLSIIKIETPDFRPMPAIPYNFTTNIKDTGSEVFTLGYPIADVMGEEVKFTDGKISSKTGIQGDVTVYQISVPIQPGNSGGPLFDTRGNLVGITSSGLNRDYFKSENVNYAIKSSYLKSLIDAMPQNFTLQTQSDVAELPLTEMIKRFQPYMVYIKVK